MADLSVIIVSHDKPRFIREALKSVLDQTHQNWQAILVDSGVLLNQGHFKEYTDPRLQIIPSGETRALAQTKNMASWCFNNVIRSGILTGELILYLCDDDLFYPEAFSTYWNFYTANDRKPQAMYASQDIGAVEGDGPLQIIGQRRAKKPAGKFCRGMRLDCKVDYLQFCHTAGILDEYRKVYKTDEIHTEDKRNAHHADGIFMERVGALTKVFNIDKVTSINRRTDASVNIHRSHTALGRVGDLIKAKLRGLPDRLRGR